MAIFRPLVTALRQDLTGRRFDRLRVIQPLGTRWGKVYWLCECDCGGTTAVATGSLNSGHIRSCGCLYDETRPKPTHGLTGTPEHRAWKGMITRCTNSRRDFWHRYGARGIAVCQRWRNSFEHFLADVGPRPTPRHTLERIDNDGNYEPSNVRWATMEEQGQNTTRTRRIAFNGETMGVSAWSRKLRRSKRTIRARSAAGLPLDS